MCCVVCCLSYVVLCVCVCVRVRVCHVSSQAMCRTQTRDEVNLICCDVCFRLISAPAMLPTNGPGTHARDRTILDSDASTPHGTWHRCMVLYVARGETTYTTVCYQMTRLTFISYHIAPQQIATLRAPQCQTRHDIAPHRTWQWSRLNTVCGMMWCFFRLFVRLVSCRAVWLCVFVMCGVMRCGVLQCNGVLCHVRWYDTVRRALVVVCLRSNVVSSCLHPVVRCGGHGTWHVTR